MPPDLEENLPATLQESTALEVVSATGPLSRLLKGFESREQQKNMLLDVIKAFNNDHIALIEAGTGTGKSVAYLLPALLAALKLNERTVISTNTINLQEQLLHKDIPLLLKALNVDLKAVLMKGMGNYICKRKADEMQHELPLMTLQESEEWGRVEAWMQTSQEGSRSTLPLVPTPGLWEKIGAEHDTCNTRDCPHFKECFYFKARKQAEDAKILIVNHHLLCSDLVTRIEKEEGILPDYEHVILDEAHNLEEIATDFFAAKFSQMSVLRTLSRLASEKQGKAHGKLSLLKHLIQTHFRNGLPEDSASIMIRLNTDLPQMRMDVSNALIYICESFRYFCNLLDKKDEERPTEESRLRLRSYHMTHPSWDNEILPNSQKFYEAAMKYVQMLESLDKDVQRLKNDKLGDQAKGLLFEIRALAGRLQSAAEMLKKYIDPKIPDEKVRWIEVQQIRTGTNVLLLNADLDISKDLAENLFNKFFSTVLVSATLTTHQKFDFIRKRLGLTPEYLIKGKTVIQNIYDSPFDYQEQALLVVPSDMPGPADRSFITEASERIWDSIQASKGNAFVLFTSYSMLKKCYDLLAFRMQEGKYNALKQGDSNRQTLLTQFKTTEKSVLFGTDSFWEGVDVVGEALRCVIIVKLPFKVPSEPIIQARSEAILARGGDPFTEYSLPLAIVKFKQGFGRLIRNRKDRGCIVCLDNRLIYKNYGQQFLKSLPPCQQLFAPAREAAQAMVDFYRRTHHLTR